VNFRQAIVEGEAARDDAQTQRQRVEDEQRKNFEAQAETSKNQTHVVEALASVWRRWRPAISAIGCRNPSGQLPEAARRFQRGHESASRRYEVDQSKRAWHPHGKR